MYKAGIILLGFLLVSMAGCAGSSIEEPPQAPDGPPEGEQVLGAPPDAPAADLGPERHWLNGSANITFTDLQVPGFGYHDGGTCRSAEAGSLTSIVRGRLWASWDAQATTEQLELIIRDWSGEFASNDARFASASGSSPLEMTLEPWDELRNVRFGITPVSMAPSAELWLVIDQEVNLNWAIEYEGEKDVVLGVGNC